REKALYIKKKIYANIDGSTVTILDLIGYKDDSFEKTDLRLLLEKVLPILSEREQKVLQYTYFENMSQKEAGELLDISQMHVSRIQRRALLKLREALQADGIGVTD